MKTFPTQTTPQHYFQHFNAKLPRQKYAYRKGDIENFLRLWKGRHDKIHPNRIREQEEILAIYKDFKECSECKHFVHEMDICYSKCSDCL